MKTSRRSFIAGLLALLGAGLYWAKETVSPLIRTLPWNHPDADPIADKIQPIWPPDLCQCLENINGFRPPRFTTAERDSIKRPAIGLEICNIETEKHEVYDGSLWLRKFPGDSPMESWPLLDAGDAPGPSAQPNVSFGNFTVRHPNGSVTKGELK